MFKTDIAVGDVVRAVAELGSSTCEKEGKEVIVEC